MQRYGDIWRPWAGSRSPSPATFAEYDPAVFAIKGEDYDMVYNVPHVRYL